MRVALAVGGGWLRLEVADGGSRPAAAARPRREVDPDAESGRGLLMVQLLAAELGGELSVVVGGLGKAVRVRVPVP